ncbi:MAG: right-handed parallel beta-helix repeat-containing protein [Bacteroidia bacterium]|nr:right-handed parallel beta-helix repeat-containing protein [Bacteroidia bacterium]
MAVTYYVSPTGNDLNTGLTAADPWQTIDRVNLAAIGPGDEVLFEGGQTFVSANGLFFTGARSGTAANPIIISSYGTGRATLNVTGAHAFVAYECAGFEITDLNFVGAGRLVNNFAGIVFYSDTGTPVIPNRYEHVLISRVEVSGFNLGGIKFQGTEIYRGSGGTQASSGWESVSITYADVHDNGDFGIEIIGDWLTGTTIYPNRDILIQNCTAYNNPGQNGLTTEHTGNGIVVGNAEDVLIDLCVAYNNGADNVANNGGPVGIWLWDTKDGIIQSSESYENKTNSTKDGGGFDLDGGCVNCVIQYCYSHDNDGAGFLLAEFGESRDMINNTIRYNISQNDGRDNDYAGIQFWRDAVTPGTGVLDQSYVYNNVVYIGAGAGAAPAAIRSISGAITNAKVSNNVFITADGIRMVDKQFATDLDFAGNAYFSLTGVYEYNEAGTVYGNLAAWRASGQEMVGLTNVGLEIDPQLVNAGNGGIIGNPNNLPTLNDYTLQAGSPLEDAGLDLNTLFGINVGARDFYGTTVPVNTTHDIGAYETPGATLSARDIKFFGERLKNGTVFLRFDLGLEEMPESLILERSLDGENFEFVLNPELKSRIGHTYDYRSPSTKVFYRLGLEDLNGEVNYSRILEIFAFENQEFMQVFPNPIKEDLGIFLRSPISHKEVVVELIDLQGKSVLKQTLNPVQDSLSLKVPNLPNGLYTLMLKTPLSIMRQQILIDK